MKYRFLCFFLLTCLLNAQTGYVKIPDQLYQSIDNKKPGGAELFHKRKTNPSSIDLSDRMPKPGYQGPIGSCAAWATGYACKTYQESVEWGFDPLDEKRQFSPSFIYNLVNEGKNKGTT